MVSKTSKPPRTPKIIRRDRLRKVAKRAAKAARKQVLDELCSKITNARKGSGDGRIPYGLVSNLVRETTPVCPWVNRDVIMNHYRTLLKAPPLPIPPPPPLIELDTDTVTSPQTRAKGGRPLGMTNEKKRSIQLAIIGAKNEIASRAQKAKRTLETGKRMAKGALAAIVRDVEENRNLPPEFSFPVASIRTRIARDKPFAFNRGHTTPLLNMEPIFVSIIKQMCQI